MSNAHRPPETLLEAIKYFADPDLALAFMVEMRWPDGVVCPVCGGKEHSFLSTRRLWKCKGCKKQFSVKLGTIFEDSPIGLDKWLPALWMLANSRNGVSSHELGRSLGVTQKSAWFMLHRIRLAMQSMTFRKLCGDVEVDETYIGGKRANMHKSKRAKMPVHIGTKHMSAVLGLLERKRGSNHSTVVVRRVRTTRKGELDKHIRSTVEQGSNVYTDAHPTYRRLADVPWGDEYAHAAVDHAIEYVSGQVHTNGIENFWSLLKRSIRGTYVSVDPFHLFRYLDEQAFRFNNRTLSDLARFRTALREIVGKRIKFDELISADMTPATT